MSSDPFGVSGSQQPAVASGGQHRQASSNVINPWRRSDLWKSSGRLVRGGKGIEISKVCSERRNLHAYLEKEAERAFQGRKCSSDKDYLRLGQKWTEEIENKEMLTLLSVKPIENSNLKDWSCIRRSDGQIRLKEKR